VARSSAAAAARTVAPANRAQDRSGLFEPVVQEYLQRLQHYAPTEAVVVGEAQGEDETARRLMSIPGFGPITASAMAATIQDTSGFAGPREFPARASSPPFSG